MSDLAATNCGCECTTGGNNGCNIIFLILLLCFCGGGNNGCFEHNCGCGNGCNDMIWIIILLCFCGGNNNFCC